VLQVQEPLEQWALALQSLPQPPQLFASVLMLTSQPVFQLLSQLA
jgi:hypothetical protein